MLLGLALPLGGDTVAVPLRDEGVDFLLDVLAGGDLA